MSEIRALLLTDVVDSTALSAAVGDATAASAWRAHDRAARDLLRRWRGREIDKSDGLLVLFERADDAVACALAYHRAIAGLPTPMKARAGVHVGAVELTANSPADIALGAKPLEVDGIAKPIAARLMALAIGGQTLLSFEAQAALSEHTWRRRSHGHWQLKGIDLPVEVFEVGDDDTVFSVPPDGPKAYRVMRSGEQWLPSTLAPNNLPSELSSFVGRAGELARLRAMLDETRLLTLLGAGGMGKTRLSLKLARQAMPDFPDGVWFVELAPLAEPQLLAQVVISALSITVEPGQSAMQALLAHVAARRMLLVLDNCEHLVHDCAELAGKLLAIAAGLKLITSSREALRIAGEQIFPVLPLTVPDPDHAHTPVSLMQYEAVRLFMDRTGACQPSFELRPDDGATLLNICRRLEGIPLAIELAAARMRAMSLPELERRLDVRFRVLTAGSRNAMPRQQTLRALLDWSHDLLDPLERALLRRLSVFSGGWTEAAASQTCAAAPIAEDEVPDRLLALVDKSLVVAEQHRGSTRFRLLETIRDYAGEHLQASAETHLFHDRHLCHFLALAEAAEPELRRADQQAWMDRLEIEHDNLRAALTWACGAGERQPEALRLAGALSRFWYVHDHLSEGRGWLSRVLSLDLDHQAASARAKALFGIGSLAWLQGDHAAAERLHEQGLGIRRELADSVGIAASLNSLSLLSRDLGQPARALAQLHESAALFEAIGDQRGMQMVLGNLGLLEKDQGHYAEARSAMERGLEIALALGNAHGVMVACINLGNVAAEQDDPQAATRFYEEGLAQARKLGDRLVVAAALNNLGNVAIKNGNFASATRLHGEGLDIRLELGARLAIADSLEGFANVAVGLNHVSRAATLWGAAERLREEIGSPLPPGRRQERDREILSARQALTNDAEFDRAWLAGRAMSMAQLAAFARSDAAMCEATPEVWGNLTNTRDQRPLCCGPEPMPDRP